ncbi:MAG TPA: 3-oxoadipate enol-lactonase [Actinomycetales bacterium]|jgi:3-oxoadipate enol-lactonase
MSGPVRLHHVVDGSAQAPAVVLLPSLGATHEMWAPQALALRDRLRVVRVDARGHGRSPVPEGPYEIDDLVGDVVRLLDELGVARAHLVGLSLGGMTAMRLAALRPDRVARMVLLCTSSRLGPASAWAERAQTVLTEGTGAVAGTVVARWFTPDFAEQHPSVVERCAQMIRDTPAPGYAACCGAIERMDLTGSLPLIQAPTLVVAGEQDPATPPDHLRVIADAVRGARFELLSPAAHLANLEQPDRVSELVRNHLTT